MNNKYPNWANKKQLEGMSIFNDTLTEFNKMTEKFADDMKNIASECPSDAGCYALTNSEYEQACVNIYMSLHVSQLDTVSKQLKDSWVVGKKIYNERKRGA